MSPGAPGTSYGAKLHYFSPRAVYAAAEGAATQGGVHYVDAQPMIDGAAAAAARSGESSFDPLSDFERMGTAHDLAGGLAAGAERLLRPACNAEVSLTEIVIDDGGQFRHRCSRGVRLTGSAICLLADRSRMLTCSVPLAAAGEGSSSSAL